MKQAEPDDETFEYNFYGGRRLYGFYPVWLVAKIHMDIWFDLMRRLSVRKNTVTVIVMKLIKVLLLARAEGCVYFLGFFFWQV